MRTCDLCGRPEWDGGHAMTVAECVSRDGDLCQVFTRVRARDAEVASLRAEVARLTEESAERLKALATATEIAREFDRRYLASRALADRLAEALREAESALTWALDRSPDAAAGMVKESAPWRARARAALREWEEARRGSEGGGRHG